MHLCKSGGSLPVKSSGVSAGGSCSRASQDWHQTTTASNMLEFNPHSAVLPHGEGENEVAQVRHSHLFASLLSSPLHLENNFWHEQIEGWVVAKSSLPFPIPSHEDAKVRKQRVSAPRCVTSAAPWQDGVSGQLAESQGYLKIITGLQIKEVIIQRQES